MELRKEKMEKKKEIENQSRRKSLPFLKSENNDEISVECDLTYNLKQNITNS